MKTECPECNTIFSITQEQLDVADGMVRCGVCSHVFNALVQDDLFVAEDASPEEPDAEPITVADQADVDAQVIAADDGAIDSASHIEAETIEPASDSPIGSYAVDEIAHDFDQPQPDTLFEGSDGQVVPDELRYQQNRLSVAAILTLGIGIVLMLCGLTLQFAWLERATLVRSDELRPWLERACMQLDCTGIEVRMPDRIEMQSRNVYTHPTVDEALMISLSLVNRAGFAQPYPDIRIHFSDVIGNLIASRRFQPHEYLGIAMQDLRMLEPDAPVSFGIGIVDPGARALTYEFEFL